MKWNVFIGSNGDPMASQQPDGVEPPKGRKYLTGEARAKVMAEMGIVDPVPDDPDAIIPKGAGEFGGLKVSEAAKLRETKQLKSEEKPLEKA